MENVLLLVGMDMALEPLGVVLALEIVQVLPYLIPIRLSIPSYGNR